MQKTANNAKPAGSFRHINIQYYAVQEWLKTGIFIILRVSIQLNTCNILTKSLPGSFTANTIKKLWAIMGQSIGLGSKYEWKRITMKLTVAKSHHFAFTIEIRIRDLFSCICSCWSSKYYSYIFLHVKEVYSWIIQSKECKIIRDIIMSK